MGKLTSNLLLPGLFLGQSLTGLAAPAGPVPAKQPAAAAPQGSVVPFVAKFDPNTSRYRLEKTEEFIQESLAKFAMRSRDTDPFGLSQDPAFQPQKPKAAPEFKKYQNIAPTPFSDVVNAIHVNGVMPSKGRFLVRDRAFQKGETFPLKYNEKVVQVLIVEVSEATIDFKNLATGETASLALNKLPPGMQRGTGNTGPPGLQRDNPSSPLEVNVPPPPTAATERR